MSISARVISNGCISSASSSTGFRVCVGSGKNRFPHPFSISTFVEATQVKCFYKKYDLWKSRLPHRLFSLCSFDLVPGKSQLKIKTKSKPHRLKPALLLVRDGNRRAPEQQEQETNITVHRKKRSIHPAEVVRRYQ